MEGEGEGSSRNMYKGHVDKAKREGVGSRVGGGDGWDGEEWWEEKVDN